VLVSSLNILRAAAALSSGSAEGGLPPHIVRFTLEYAGVPDLAKERERIRALLQADGFELDSFDPDLLNFAVLQFPGVARTISTPTLYAMADELARNLGLVSCVPDIGATFVEDPNPDDPITESAIGDAILKITCLVDEDTGLPKQWPISSLRADRAWAKTRGAGIVIAQPDTGVAKHVEVDPAAIDLAKAWNILNNTKDPTDPLPAGSGNPGHGTATASVAISRKVAVLIGSAPEATLVPIRCVQSVIIRIDGSPLARAVLHAKRVGADIITMSLGGPFYHAALGEAIRQAVDAGIIVLAAAGNCVQPIVVYPASDPNVIALAGINHNDLPWKGSSRGPKIDVAAPAENVFVARREPGDGGVGTVKPSQGTSFASALTAGVAALWLAHFTRAAVKAEASKRGITVHQLFRSALRATARPPKSGAWDKSKFGAGIVDADALLKLALKDIPAPPPVPEAVPTDDPEAAVSAVMTEAVMRRTNGFDWRRHGAEAVFLATDAWRRASPSHEMLVESARKPRPSSDLEASAPAVLRAAIAQASDAPAMRAPIVAEARRSEAICSLAARGKSGTESSARMTVEQARKELQNGGIDSLQQLVADAFAKLDAEGGNLEGAARRKSVQENLERVVNSVVADGEFSLGVNERVTLEALVKLTDRPALRVTGGTLDPTDPLFGEWGGTLIGLDEMPRLTNAVGRIDGDGQHIGTGFVIGAGIIMTNRHVLEAIAEEVSGPAGGRWEFSVGVPTIDFSETADGSARFRIKKVIAAGAQPIEGKVRLDHLDMALLEVETTNAAGDPLPQALPLIDACPELKTKGDMFTIGFPARPGTSSMIDPKTGAFSMEVSKRLAQIFNLKFGRKYLSPGAVDHPVDVTGDTQHWVFTHDATTLGGNSGSAAIRVMAPLGVSGLHFGGATLTANYAHSLAAVKASGKLTALKDPSISWL
jgi:serine protease